MHSGSPPGGMVPPGHSIFSDIFGAQGLVGDDGQVHVSGSGLRQACAELLVIVVDCGTFLAV